MEGRDALIGDDERDPLMLQLLHPRLMLPRRLLRRSAKPDCPITLVARPGVSSLSTASATGRFGLGAVTVFAGVQLAVRTDPASKRIESLAENESLP